MKRWFIALGALLTSVLTAVGLKYRGDAYKAKAKNERERADSYEETISDVETSNRANADPTERDRVRDKYTRD